MRRGRGFYTWLPGGEGEGSTWLTGGEGDGSTWLTGEDVTGFFLVERRRGVDVLPINRRRCERVLLR
jgi:hypothetical protein